MDFFIPPTQALSQALLQVRADLVETVQRTVEGVADRERQEINVKLLVEKRTTVLQVQRMCVCVCVWGGQRSLLCLDTKK